MKSAVPMLLLLALPRTGGEESSDVYLRNVVEELQILNGVVPSDRSPRVSYEEVAPSVSSTEDTDNHQQPSQQHYQTLPKDAAHLLEPPPLQESPPPPPPAAASQPQPRPQPAPMILGFSASELASMYRKAMERGVPVKHQHHYQQHRYPAAEYGFNRGKVIPEYGYEQRPPKVVPALRLQPPTGYGNDYAYYFYPLHSFRHELEKPSGYHPAVSEYHTLPDSAYAAATMVDPGKKETSGTSLMSHIITGVSSFIGMAVFFFFSMFVYPRFLHMMHFPFASTSRTNFRDELANLAAFVSEAIAAYNQNTRHKSKQLPQR